MEFSDKQISEKTPSPYIAGLLCRCPRCGKGKLFAGFLTLKSKCDVCGLDFSFADAGDGPAIFVIMIAGAIVVGAALLTGHSYIVYGPLALAASSVVYEGLPTYPDAGRPWRIAEELDINIFHTSPTAIRSLRRAGPDEPLKYNHHFKHMTTVGEPIEPAVWKWYYEVVGKGEAIIVDTWWQTENGGFLPWPGTFQTIWNNPDRYVEQYCARYCKDRKSRDWRDWPYLCNDGALQAADGYYRILGRIDDVINVAGHRLGTKEIESASLLVDEVAEAAVVPARDEIKGKIPDLYVSLKPGLAPNEAVRKRVEDSVIRVRLGPSRAGAVS